MSAPILSDKELLRKAFMKKVKRGGVIAVVIFITTMVAFFVLRSPGELSIKYSWNDNRPLYGSPFFVHLEGTIFNSGTKNATNVKLVVRLYDSHNTLIKTETVDVGNILAEGFKSISIDIQHSGFVDRCDTELRWNP